MPLLNGFEAARQIIVASSKSKQRFLTEHEASTMVRHALSLGVNGYLLKSLVVTELLPALEAVTLGEVFISERLRLEDLPAPDSN
jgi:DNA-binding NarL/FixJ family response regulator